MGFPFGLNEGWPRDGERGGRVNGEMSRTLEHYWGLMSHVKKM